MVFDKEDNILHEENNTCHICGKTGISKVRDHCHEIGKYGGPACKMCILRYKQQNFNPVIFHNGSDCDFNLLYSEPFKHTNDRRKVDSIPIAAGKFKMFSIVCLQFLDSYNFLSLPLDQKATIYGCRTKTLYPCEHIGLDKLRRVSGLGSPTTTKSYDNLIGRLNIEELKSSLSNKLPTQEKVDYFNEHNSQKTGKDLTKEYLQYRVMMWKDK